MRPNVGDGEAYRKALDKLIDQMNASLLYWLTARWNDNPPQLAMDESWSRKLTRTMKELGERWQSRFDEAAPRLAEHFTKRADQRTSNQLKAILDDAGMLVNFKTSPLVKSTLNATIQQNVSLIKSIASEHLTDVEGIVYRSVATGRDLHSLAKALKEQFDVPKKRAAFIARDQHNKASAAITRVRQHEAGIDKAIWFHSHAGKKPRPEHVAFANGQLGGPVYEVAKGAFLEGVWTFPGVEIHCRCFCKPILPGLQ